MVDTTFKKVDNVLQEISTKEVILVHTREDLERVLIDWETEKINVDKEIAKINMLLAECDKLGL